MQARTPRADIEQQFACFSSSSARGAALSRAGQDCSAAYRLDGRLTSTLSGCGPHQSSKMPLQCRCCTGPQQTRGVTKGWEVHKKESSVFLFSLTWGPLRLLNDLSLQSILTGFLSIIVWTFQMRNIFQMVFHGVTHLVHFLLILYQCGACVCWISWPLVTLHAAFLRTAHSKCCTLNSDCRGFIEKLTLNLKLANTLLGISSAGMAVGMKQIGWTVLEIYKLQTVIDLCFWERCASTCQCNVFTADEPNR